MSDEPRGHLSGAEDYAGRMARLGELVGEVRLHRTAGCDASPLCPGGEVVTKVLAIPPTLLLDFIVTCLARLADQDGELESLRVEVQQGRERLATAQDELASCSSDAEAGWAAWRLERSRRLGEGAEQ